MCQPAFPKPRPAFHAFTYGAIASLCCGVFVLPLAAADSTELRSQFAHPPRQYSSAPLWVWNDMLTEEEIIGTLRDLAGQNVKQVFVHPRPGLMTPYLSEQWFRLWKVALKEAERLDMNVWIYDENSYPSGFAGGFVPEVMPQSRGKGLEIKRAADAAQSSNEELRGGAPADGGWLRKRHPAGQSRSSSCPGQVHGRFPALGRHVALARRQVLRQPPDRRRDGEVPGDHAGRLHPRDRRPVRQTRARRLHR